MKIFNTMNKLCTAVAMTAATANADVIFDNIGAMDGSNMAGEIHASQQFEAMFAQYDIAAVDDFTLAEDTHLDSVSFILGGYNGYVDTDAVVGYTFNVYSSIAAASNSLLGDVISLTYFGVGPNGNWNGGYSDHVTLELGGVALGAGDYFLSVVPINEFGINGVTGILTALTGGDNGYQANPSEGWGFGSLYMTGANYAYSLEGSAIPGPAAFCLLGIAGATIRRRRR
jgi:hypothetical protein